MLFKVKLENTEIGTRISVSIAETDELIYQSYLPFACNPKELRAGGKFAYRGDWYYIFGPSQWLDEGGWRVYKLVQASERA